MLSLNTREVKGDSFRNMISFCQRSARYLFMVKVLHRDFHAIKNQLCSVLFSCDSALKVTRNIFLSDKTIYTKW